MHAFCLVADWRGCGHIQLHCSVAWLHLANQLTSHHLTSPHLTSPHLSCNLCWLVLISLASFALQQTNKQRQRPTPQVWCNGVMEGEVRSRVCCSGQTVGTEVQNKLAINQERREKRWRKKSRHKRSSKSKNNWSRIARERSNHITTTNKSMCCVFVYALKTTLAVPTVGATVPYR